MKEPEPEPEQLLYSSVPRLNQADHTSLNFKCQFNAQSVSLCFETFYLLLTHSPKCSPYRSKSLPRALYEL